jgi:hypothetical protein
LRAGPEVVGRREGTPTFNNPRPQKGRSTSAFLTENDVPNKEQTLRHGHYKKIRKNFRLCP